MPYKSKAQRGYMHARAAEGDTAAKKFVKKSDKMKQPGNKTVKKVSKYKKAK